MVSFVKSLFVAELILHALEHFLPAYMVPFHDTLNAKVNRASNHDDLMELFIASTLYEESRFFKGIWVSMIRPLTHPAVVIVEYGRMHDLVEDLQLLGVVENDLGKVLPV